MIPFQPMSKIVRSAACILYPSIIVFGMYLILHGHPTTPGGGFQGGAVIASAVALIIVAHDTPFFSRHKLVTSLCIGLLLFITIGFLGMNQAFLHNFLVGFGGLVSDSPYAFKAFGKSGTILLLNIAVGLEVVGSLSLLLLKFSGAPERAGESS